MCLPKASAAPQMPAPIPTPPPVVNTTVDNAQSTDARKKQQQAAAAAGGQQSTIATSPLGVPSAAPTTKAKLLGQTTA